MRTGRTDWRRCTPIGSAFGRPLARRVPPEPAADEPLSFLLRRLQELFQLRGVSYVCVVDEAAGRVAGDCGIPPGEGVALGLVEWVRDSAAASSGTGPTRPDDVMITTSTGHHLLQRVRSSSPEGPTTTAWMYLHVVRDRGTVAVARQALASVAGVRKDPVAAPPAPEAVRPTPSAPAPTAAAPRDTTPPLDTRIPLPRRPSASLPPPPPPRRPTGTMPAQGRATVLDRSWATDLSTLKRLLVGLHQLA